MYFISINTDSFFNIVINLNGVITLVIVFLIFSFRPFTLVETFYSVLTKKSIKTIEELELVDLFLSVQEYTFLDTL